MTVLVSKPPEKATKCTRCEEPLHDDKYYTELNPLGGYGRDQVLCCDACLAHEDMKWWRDEFWPNWPEPRRKP